ncbi:unnamed protein product [Notodromas monacha]|uniref:START domain-containing protein n=1 Tax=Notodromas monacha TaxID=399045 RepID=A0A7R9GFL2_9CRUS|nr:unnamed protein product [Notodromas monacha]CAG0919266.1 unnamed protein product [Notodromas monacha]
MFRPPQDPTLPVFNGGEGGGGGRGDVPWSNGGRWDEWGLLSRRHRQAQRRGIISCGLPCFCPIYLTTIMIPSVVANTLLLVSNLVVVDRLDSCDVSDLSSSNHTYPCYISPGSSLRNIPAAPGEITDENEIEEQLDSMALQFLQQAKDNQRQVVDLIESGGWEKTQIRDGIKLRRLFHTVHRRYVYLTELEVSIEIKTCFQVTIENSETQHEWNPGMKQVKTIHKINENTVLTHQVTSPELAGLISPREMLLLTQWSLLNDSSYLISYASTEWPEFKPNYDYVLAYNGPSGFLFVPLAGNRTRVLWLFNADLKYNSVPSSIINALAPSAVINYMKHWRQFLLSHLPS